MEASKWPDDAESIANRVTEASHINTGKYPIHLGNNKYDYSIGRIDAALKVEHDEKSRNQHEYFAQPSCSEEDIIKFNKIKEKYGDSPIPQSNFDNLIDANKMNSKCKNKLDYLNKHRGLHSRKPIEGGKKSRKKKRTIKKKKKTKSRSK